MSQSPPRRDETAGVDLAHLRERAATLARMQRFEEALAACQEIIAHRPADPEALNESGGLCMRLGRPHDAFTYYDRAVASAPEFAVLHINKGAALSALNRFPEALASFAAAANVEPCRAEAHYNAALVHLRHGDFAAGWPGHEWRWRKADWAGRRRNFTAPLWLGKQSIEGKTILLHAEQGFGDTIQFVRYAPLVARRGARVILECPPELAALLRSVEGVSQVIERGAALPFFDFHCPLMSLPLAFGTQLATIPASVPYLRPDQMLLSKWRARLPQTGRLRVGLCWTGSREHLNDHNRSIPLASFASLLAVSGIDFVSMQKDVDPVQAEILQDYGVLSLGRELADFADTAAGLALLDLVVAVDTSVAHLAGAVGKVVALLLPFSPDWRWLLDRTDCVWYPTMRIFRQAALQDWSEPVERLRQELAEAAERRMARS